MSKDFTLDKFLELCGLLERLPCEIMTVAQFLRAGQPRRSIVMLRHDVDRALDSALRMAQVEACLGLKATYYVRVTSTVFRPDGLVRLQQQGHDIGYHYESLVKVGGDRQRAIVAFEQDLACLRQVVPVETISMHGSPLSKWNNLDLWRDHDFSVYGLKDVFLSINYEHVYYFTDTGRTWKPGHHNLRDRIIARQPKWCIRTTDELMAFLRDLPDGPVLINAHPNRWAADQWAWGVSLVSDWLSNQAKRFLSWLHRRSQHAQA